MEVIKISPRGYCHGVVDAIAQMKHIAGDPSVERPIHILGKVVHNQKIVDDLEALGLRTVHEEGVSRLELLDRIDRGTVVFTAHGVSDSVYKKAISRGLNVIDTTCRDVRTSQRTIAEYLDHGYDVLFIGKEDHPESETATGYEGVHLITSVKDVESFSTHNKHIAVTNQTTMSLFDIYSIHKAIQKRFPDATLIDEVCDATRMRQLAIKNQPADVEHCFVVGDRHSNNSNKLRDVSMQAGVPATLVESVEDIKIGLLQGLRKVSVTSGASTPTAITREVIEFLTAYDPSDASTHRTRSHVKQRNLFLKE